CAAKRANLRMPDMQLKLAVAYSRRGTKRRRISGEVEEEFTPPGALKHIGDAALREQPAFLLHQDFKRRLCCVRIGVDRKADLAEFGQPLALGAVAAAGRRRALGGIEFFPVAAEFREMCAARVGRKRQREEWIDLAADELRHLLKFDPVVAVQRLALHAPAQFLPQRAEPLRRDVLREVAEDER